MYRTRRASNAAFIDRVAAQQVQRIETVAQVAIDAAVTRRRTRLAATLGIIEAEMMLHAHVMGRRKPTMDQQ